MKKSIVLVLAIALCGCVSSKRTVKPLPTKAQILGKAPAVNTTSLSPVSAPKGLTAPPAMPTPSPVLVMSPLVKVVYNANSFWFRFNCPHPTNVHGYVWFKNQNGLNGKDVWVLSFSAEDNGTNSTSIAPAMANGKPGPNIYGEFRGSETVPGALMTARPDSFLSNWRAQKADYKARLGKNANLYGMTTDGRVVKLTP